MTVALTIEAVKAVRKHGTIFSYDLNYRPSLWKTIVGLKKAQEGNREISKYVDVVIGNEEDFTASLGFAVKGAEDLKHIEIDAFKVMIETAVKEFKNFRVAATTLRHVHTATSNDWSASPDDMASRAALLTGLMPARNGAEPNHSRPQAELKKLPAYLRAAAWRSLAHIRTDSIFRSQNSWSEMHSTSPNRQPAVSAISRPLPLFPVSRLWVTAS